MRQKILIGIDPAFRESGFTICIFDITDRSVLYKVFNTYNEFLYWLLSEDSPKDARVIIEDSNLQNVTFGMKAMKRAFFSSMKKQRKPKSVIQSAWEGVIAKRSRDVGKNQGISSLTVKACIDKYGGENVRAVSPKGKGLKLTHDQYIRILNQEKISLTNDKKTSSQDERDAFKLCMMRVF